MTISTNPTGLVARLNAVTENSVGALLRLIGFGSLVRRMKTVLARQNPFAAAVNPYVGLSTLTTITLPDDAKASAISRCYARAQDASTTTGSPGELTIKTPYGTTPTTGTVGISPSGDLVFLKTDAFNDVDLDYDVAPQDVYELTVNVVPGTGILTIPTKYAGAAPPGTNLAPGVRSLLEIEVLAGTTTGKFAVLVPGTTPGTSAQACLSVNKTQVLFKVSDAVTQARIKFGALPGTVVFTGGGQPAASGGVDLNAVLEAASPIP